MFDGLMFDRFKVSLLGYKFSRFPPTNISPIMYCFVQVFWNFPDIFFFEQIQLTNSALKKNSLLSHYFTLFERYKRNLSIRKINEWINIHHNYSTMMKQWVFMKPRQWSNHNDYNNNHFNTASWNLNTIVKPNVCWIMLSDLILQDIYSEKLRKVPWKAFTIESF